MGIEGSLRTICAHKSPKPDVTSLNASTKLIWNLPPAPPQER
jgi:hypothetical protein